MSQIRLPARHGPADPRHAHRCPPDLAGGTAAPSRVNRLITPVGRPGDRRRRRAAGPRPRQHRPCPGCRPATQQAHQCHVAVSDATHRTGRSALHAPRGRHTTRNTESAVGGVARVVMRSAAVTWSNRCWDSCGCAMPGALWMPSMRYTTVRALLTGIPDSRRRSERSTPTGSCGTRSALHGPAGPGCSSGRRQMSTRVWLEWLSVQPM